MPAAAADAETGLRWIDTFAPGDHPGDGPGEVWSYSERDVAGIARTTAALMEAGLHRPPVVVTHDGVEAYGAVAAVRMQGGRLQTAWKDVQPDLARAIKDRRFDSVSAEIRDEFLAPDGTRYGPYLFRVAVLGADVPRVKGLAPLSEARWFSDAGPPARRMQGVRPMADGVASLEDAAVEQLKAKGLSEETCKALAKDEKLLAMVLADLTGGGAPAAGSEGGAAMAMVDGVEMDRQSIIDELVNTYGYDPAELDGKTDDELAALLSQERAAGSANMSEGIKPAGAATSGVTAATAGAGANPPAPQPAALEAAVEAVLERKFSEKVRPIEGALAAYRRESVARAAAERRANEEAKLRVAREVVTDLVRTGHRPSRVLDDTNPAALSLPRQLALLDNTRPLTRTFSEGGKSKTIRRTAFEEAIEALKIEQREQPVYRFSEQAVQGGGGQARVKEMQELAKSMAERKGGGRTLEEKLGMLPRRAAR